MNAPLRLFVLGASAGGHPAILKILQDVPEDINAAFLVVVHIAMEADASSALYLQKRIKLKVKYAEQNMPIEAGTVYLAVFNHHLFVHDSVMLLSNGPRENRFRPAIDVLFRSAAVAYKNQCVGILLTGRLSDGTAGLEAIKKCGGLAIIQNPLTAEFPEMPLTAQQSVAIDYTLDLEEIAGAIQEIMGQALPEEKKVPLSLIKEASIAMKIKSQVRVEQTLGKEVPLSCSSCGGPLWKMTDADTERYRCHVGHAFSQEALLQSQQEKLEETLWISLRTFEEKRILLQKMAAQYRSKGFDMLVRSYEDKLAEVNDHIERLRSLMQIHD